MHKKICITLGLMVIAMLSVLTMRIVSSKASSIVVTFDYNTESIKHYLPSVAFDNLITTDVSLDSPAIINEPIVAKPQIKNYYKYYWEINNVRIDLDTFVFFQNTRVVAVWEPIEYTIYYNYLTPEEKLEIRNLQETDYYSIEKPVTFYRPVRNGYTFVDWYSSSNFGNDEIELFTKSYSVGDKFLYAKFNPITYYIDYHTDANNINNPQYYSIESPTFALAEPNKEGHIFLGWFYDPNFVYPCEEIISGSTGQIDLYPKWLLVTYNVTYVLPSGETQVVSVQYGHNAVAPKTNKSIFEILCYDKTNKNITGETIIYVKYENIWYLYLIATLLIVGVILWVILYKRNKYQKMHKLRYIYHSNRSK